MHSHPSFPGLVRSIRQAGAMVAPWEGRVFRAVEIKWAKPALLLSGEGTRKHGGRWMRAGVAEVAHAAMTETLAIKESRHTFDYYGIHKPRNNPRVSVEIRVKLAKVLPLGAVEAVFPHLTNEELLREDWEKVNGQGSETLAQAIGRAAWQIGLEGMMVPSARDRRSRNLVWFPGNLSAGSVCTITAQHELEAWLAE